MSELDQQSLTTSELAARWEMSPQTLRRWRMKKIGPPWFRPNGGDAGEVRYRLADILAWEKAAPKRNKM
jgi:DNA-binding transcriptional MerR regulator